MSWYAAHIVILFRFLDDPQDSCPVWENVHLIRAGSEDEAFAKALSIGTAAEGDDDGSLMWGDHRATREFAGVRKIVSCGDLPSDELTDGIEATYSELLIADRNDLERFVAGDSVTVRCDA